MDIVKCVEILKSRHNLHAGGCDCATRGYLLEVAPPPPPGIVADLLSANQNNDTYLAGSRVSASDTPHVDGGGSMLRGNESVDKDAQETASTTAATAPLPSAPISVFERVRALSLYELIGVLLSLQSERVQTYKIFDEILNVLIEENRIGEYKMLCGEVTSRFAIISKAMRDIITELKMREQNSLAVMVEKIQLLEKEKLTLYASKHIDEIQSRSEDLREHFPSTPQKEYTTSALKRIEGEVADQVEALQAEKSELV